jgi:hypothetical protein
MRYSREIPNYTHRATIASASISGPGDVSHFISVYRTSCLVYSKGVVYTSMSIVVLCLFQGRVRLRRPTRLPQVLQLSSLFVEVSRPIHMPPHPFPRHFSKHICYCCVRSLLVCPNTTTQEAIDKTSSCLSPATTTTATTTTTTTTTRVTRPLCLVTAHHSA